MAYRLGVDGARDALLVAGARRRGAPLEQTRSASPGPGRPRRSALWRRRCRPGSASSRAPTSGACLAEAERLWIAAGFPADATQTGGNPGAGRGLDPDWATPGLSGEKSPDPIPPLPCRGRRRMPLERLSRTSRRRRVDRTRQHDAAGLDAPESDATIIGLVADQHDEPLPSGLGRSQRCLHQRQANAAGAKRRLDRQGAQQEGL